MRGLICSLGIVGGIVVAGALLFHAMVPPFYRFPTPQPFSGDAWLNPYDGFNERPRRRVNLHAHTRAWAGLSYGAHTADEVRAHYGAMGYDLAAISNYQQIARAPDDGRPWVSAYEHGYSVRSRHHTVLGGTSVNWIEFPLWQDLRHKQFVLDRLNATSSLVIINHPDKNTGYTRECFRYLTGYVGLEIRSKSAKAVHLWDEALSAGRRVWGFTSDDGHDISRRSHSGIGWLEVAAGAETGSILGAVERGCFYSLFTRRKDPPNRLESVTFDDGVLAVVCRDPATSIRFIGQGGIVRRRVGGVRRASYAVTEADTYLRVEVETGRTTLYLNPLTRGRGVPREAEALPIVTNVFRLTVALVIVLGGIAWRVLRGAPVGSGWHARRPEVAASRIPDPS